MKGSTGYLRQAPGVDTGAGSADSAACGLNLLGSNHIHGVLFWKNPERWLPILAIPETRLFIPAGNTPVLPKPETPLPRLETPEMRPP